MEKHPESGNATNTNGSGDFSLHKYGWRSVISCLAFGKTQNNKNKNKTKNMEGNRNSDAYKTPG